MNRETLVKCILPTLNGAVLAFCVWLVSEMHQQQKTIALILQRMEQNDRILSAHLGARWHHDTEVEFERVKARMGMIEDAIKRRP